MSLRRAAFGAALAIGAAAAAAQDQAPFKLTIGSYRLSGDGGHPAGTDVNLRWRDDQRTLWLGVYQDSASGRQWRGGWDANWNLAEAVVLQPSLQAAGGGFVGGSIALQVGSPWYGQLGFGRTNLRPYANLNFDPNDAITLAAGWQGDGGRQLAVTLIADDRLGTGQKHLHLGGRWPLAGQRLTFDLLHKRGQGDDGRVDAWGWTLGWDWPRVFVRLARDPKQNFSAFDAWRLSGGIRF